MGQDAARKQLVELGMELDDALDAVKAAKAKLREAVVSAAAAGVTEVDIAALAAVARSTVRDWLGKGT